MELRLGSSSSFFSCVLKCRLGSGQRFSKLRRLVSFEPAVEATKGWVGGNGPVSKLGLGHYLFKSQSTTNRSIMDAKLSPMQFEGIRESAYPSYMLKVN